MLQVVVQSAMRQLKSRWRLPAPPSISHEKEIKSERKDRTGFILIFAVGGGILLMAIFSNLPSH